MPRDRAFVYAVAVSVLFHLSMVTLFSIVIVFPRQDPHYYTFEIIDPRTRQPLIPIRQRLLRLPSVEHAFAMVGRELDKGAPLSVPVTEALPEIELPRLRPAEFQWMGTYERDLEEPLWSPDPLGPEPRDSWARFGQELGRVRSALARLAFADWRGPEEVSQPPSVSRPAPGFEAHVEWMSDPRDRRLILAPPIEALWEVDTPDVNHAVSLVFRVDPQGHVAEVLTTVEEDAGLLAAMGRGLLRYRFEPLDTPMAHDQYGTWTISRAGTVP